MLASTPRPPPEALRRILANFLCSRVVGEEEISSFSRKKGSVHNRDMKIRYAPGNKTNDRPEETHSEMMPRYYYGRGIKKVPGFY